MSSTPNIAQSKIYDQSGFIWHAAMFGPLFGVLPFVLPNLFRALIEPSIFISVLGMMMFTVIAAYVVGMVPGILGAYIFLKIGKSFGHNYLVAFLSGTFMVGLCFLLFMNNTKEILNALSYFFKMGAMTGGISGVACLWTFRRRQQKELMRAHSTPTDTALTKAYVPHYTIQSSASAMTHVVANDSRSQISQEPTCVGMLPILCVSIVGLIAVFFWALPNLGHKLLLRDDYYGLARSEIFRAEDVDCSTMQREEVEGQFLGIYDYRAVITQQCRRDQNADAYTKALIRISVVPPHTFLTASSKFFSGSLPYTTIFSEERGITPQRPE